ncbi:aromatase/cyclase (plasmid) [Streptomyces sp. AD2-2]|nr:aromatase/cyclase [Streptomyces sp. AD2-2]
MAGERDGRAVHRIQVAAPAGVVYAVLADAANLPLYFAPSVHVEQLDADGGHERLRMWFLVGGRLESWTSWRTLDPVERRIEIRPEGPGSPLESMRGMVSIRDRGPHASELELRYGFATADGPAAGHLWPGRVADLNIRTQLTQLKRFAEHWSRLDDLVLNCEDSVRVQGPAEAAYDFLYRAGDWPAHVAHISAAQVSEQAPGIQRLTLRTPAGDGVHTSESVRICFPHAGRIVHKQTTPAPLLAAHTGEWSLTEDEHGATLTSRQTVVLCEEDIPALLGEGSDLADARRQVHAALTRDCRELLTLAKQHAESSVRMLVPPPAPSARGHLENTWSRPPRPDRGRPATGTVAAGHPAHSVPVPDRPGPRLSVLRLPGLRLPSCGCLLPSGRPPRPGYAHGRCRSGDGGGSGDAGSGAAGVRGGAGATGRRESSGPPGTGLRTTLRTRPAALPAGRRPARPRRPSSRLRRPGRLPFS